MPQTPLVNLGPTDAPPEAAVYILPLSYNEYGDNRRTGVIVCHGVRYEMDISYFFPISVAVDWIKAVGAKIDLIMSWCEQNCSGVYRLDRGVMSFDRDEDRVLFMIHYGMMEIL